MAVLLGNGGLIRENTGEFYYINALKQRRGQTPSLL